MINIKNNKFKSIVIIIIMFILQGCVSDTSELLSVSDIQSKKAYILYSQNFSDGYSVTEQNIYSSDGYSFIKKSIHSPDFNLNFDINDKKLYYISEVALGTYDDFHYRTPCGKNYIDGDLDKIGSIKIDKNKIYYLGNFNHIENKDSGDYNIHLSQKDFKDYKNNNSVLHRDPLLLPIMAFYYPIMGIKEGTLSPYDKIDFSNYYYSKTKMFSCNDSKDIAYKKISDNPNQDFIVQCDTKNTFSLNIEDKFNDAKAFLRKEFTTFGKNFKEEDIINISKNHQIYNDAVVKNYYCPDRRTHNSDLEIWEKKGL